MKYTWLNYCMEDAQSKLVEQWIDDYTKRKTGLDDGFALYYNYIITCGEYHLDSDFWCKLICSGGIPVGVISLAADENGILTVMEFIIDPKKRGQGLGGAALSELVEHADAIIGREISEAEAVIFSNNIPSQKAFEHAGFHFDHAHPDGDAWYYVLKKHDFKKN